MQTPTVHVLGRVVYAFICTRARKLIKPILFNDFRTRTSRLYCCHARAAETGRKRVSFVLKTRPQPCTYTTTGFPENCRKTRSKIFFRLYSNRYLATTNNLFLLTRSRCVVDERKVLLSFRRVPME